MNTLGATELGRLRSAAAESFFDTAALGTQTGGGFGQVDVTPTGWTYGAAFACGIHEGEAMEVVDGSQAVQCDAVIRVPADIAVAIGNRLEITYRHTELLASPEYYAIKGLGRSGVGFQKLYCARLTGNDRR